MVAVDEGDSLVRSKNRKLLSNLQHEYYGPSERAEWFKKRFGASYEKLLSVIPERCHAETSFGFLVAYEENPDMIVEIDDDVFPPLVTLLLMDTLETCKATMVRPWIVEANGTIRWRI